MYVQNPKKVELANNYFVYQTLTSKLGSLTHLSIKKVFHMEAETGHMPWHSPAIDVVHCLLRRVFTRLSISWKAAFEDRLISSKSHASGKFSLRWLYSGLSSTLKSSYFPFRCWQSTVKLNQPIQHLTKKLMWHMRCMAVIN